MSNPPTRGPRDLSRAPREPVAPTTEELLGLFNQISSQQAEIQALTERFQTLQGSLEGGFQQIQQGIEAQFSRLAAIRPPETTIPPDPPDLQPPRSTLDPTSMDFTPPSEPTLQEKTPLSAAFNSTAIKELLK